MVRPEQLISEKASVHLVPSTMHASIFFLAGGICFLYGLYSLHSRYQASRWLSNIPILGFDQNDDWRRYQDDYRSLIRSGYAKYSRHGQIFRTKNPDGGWRIIISLDHLRQIKHASNKTLSWQRQIQDQLMMVSHAMPTFMKALLIPAPLLDAYCGS